MDMRPPPRAGNAESQQDGKVGISVGSDDFPDEFPPEEPSVPPLTRNRATDGFGDQDSRLIAPGTNLKSSAGNLTDEKKSKDAAANRMPEFAEEFPSEDAVVVRQSASMPEGKNPRLGAKKLSRLEHQQPVEGSASYASPSIIDGINQDTRAIPGAFPVPGMANPSNLDTPSGTAADNQVESEEPVVLGDNLRTTPPGSDFLFVEAERVQEYDVVEAQRVNSVVIRDETERPLKWHKKISIV